MPKALLPILLLPLTIMGQIPGRTIRAIVVNASGEPISYATIRLPGRSTTTMTNEKGHFVFKLPSDSKDESLLITHVGYTPKTLRIGPQDSIPKLIILKESDEQLPAVVVKTPNPLELIRQAIRRIPDNYSTTPFRLTGFYRLDGKKEARVIDLSEAVFKIYSNGYPGKISQFQLVRSRLDKDLTAFNGSDQISMGWKPSGVMSFDFVRDPESWHILSPEVEKDMKLTYKGLVNYNGREAYLITFEERTGIKKSFDDGRVYLAADDLAFLELDLTPNQQGLRYREEWSKIQRVLFSMSHIEARLLTDTIKITYRKYGSKYYLDHAIKKTNYYIAGGNRHYLLNPLSVRTNYLVTDIDTADLQPIPQEEILKEKASIEAKSRFLNDTPDSPDKSDTTDQFWADYNLIEAEFNVDSAIRVIQTNNTTLNLKTALETILRKYKKDRIARIDTILSFYHAKEQFNGAALIQYKGQTIYERGFGPANISRSLPNTPSTQFRIGSASKQFTAMLIMQLVSEGKLSVEDTAGKYLPGFKNGRVTIRQLLTHQSGIPNYTENPETLAAIYKHPYTTDELVYKFCGDSLEFQPDSSFAYTNSGFVALAGIIEKVTGKKYGTVLAERIFQPLGMKSSFFALGNDSSNLAAEYLNGQPVTSYPVQNVVGAGGITSSPHDLLRYANALSANSLLPANLTEELFKPRVAWDEWNAWYGYGWMIDRHIFQASNHHSIQYHPGIENGFHAMFLRQPDKAIVIILLSNMGDFPRFDISDLILNELN